MFSEYGRNGVRSRIYESFLYISLNLKDQRWKDRLSKGCKNKNDNLGSYDHQNVMVLELFQTLKVNVKHLQLLGDPVLRRLKCMSC